MMISVWRLHNLCNLLESSGGANSWRTHNYVSFCALKPKAIHLLQKTAHAAVQLFSPSFTTCQGKQYSF